MAKLSGRREYAAIRAYSERLRRAAVAATSAELAWRSHFFPGKQPRASPPVALSKRTRRRCV